MPIYEYICKNCGHHLEELQGINDEPLRKCPECHKLKLEKQISAPAFHLKGSGWYVTDFRDKKKDNPGGGESSKLESPKTENTQTESKSSESKSEDKKTDKPTKEKKENAKKTTKKAD